MKRREHIYLAGRSRIGCLFILVTTKALHGSDSPSLSYSFSRCQPLIRLYLKHTRSCKNQQYYGASDLLSLPISSPDDHTTYPHKMERSRHAPPLQTGNLPAVSEDAWSATNSPARGREMRTNLLQKLRAPPLVHTWDFWHEKPGTAPPSSSSPPSNSLAAPSSHDNQYFAPDLTNLVTITDVKTFWSVHNNFDLSSLHSRASVHLFHTHVKPIWEDPRNVRGGSWTFRVPKAAAQEFWLSVCLAAIGERLQEAVKSDRITFKDDICGISFRPRFTSTLITIWNRDGDHEQGIQRIAKTVIETVPQDIKPNEGSYYYKKHSEHDGFDKATAEKIIEAEKAKKYGEAAGSTGDKKQEIQAAQAKSEEVHSAVGNMEAEVQKMKQTLDEVEVHDDLMDKKVAAGAEQ